jgi:X-Pro dipeptidyl-peptidase
MARTVPLILLVFSLFATALAGCLGPSDVQTAATDETDAMPLDEVLTRLSPRLGDLPILHDVLDIDTRHGVVNVDLYLPEVTDERKLPLILVASPYSSGAKNAADMNWVALPLYDWIRAEMIPRGYAFAQMDILGTRNSGGCMGINSIAERQATADVIDFLGTQDWSNGKVGMIGKSYLAKSQTGAAIEAPEHLTTIVPISGVSQQYAYHYYNGVPYLGNQATNAAYLGTNSAPAPEGDPATYGARYPERFPCMPEHLIEGVNPLGDYSARWQERDYRPHISKAATSVFFIHGLQDWNVKPDNILDNFENFTGPKMAMLGQWGHDYPNINSFDETRFGERADWYLYLHRWFDWQLLGLDNGLAADIEACPVQVQGSDATWRCTGSFPPQDAAWLTLHAQADGTLAQTPGDGALQYQDTARTGMGVASGAGAPGTQKFAMELNDSLRIVGAPNVGVRLSTTSAFNTFVSAALAVEHNGTLEEFSWGFQSLRHRDGLEGGQPVVPGESYDVAFRMFPVDHILEPGDKLVLVLRGDSMGARVGTIPNPTPGLQTVTLGEATFLRLPTLSVAGAFTPLAASELPAEYLIKEA